MPLSPQQALSKSELLVMNDDDRAAFDRIKTAIDKGLVEQWPGGPFTAQTEPCQARVAGHLMRAYGQSGWTVMVAPMDGKMGKAQELLQAGASVNWLVQLVPDWSRGHINGTRG